MTGLSALKSFIGGNHAVMLFFIYRDSFFSPDPCTPPWWIQMPKQGARGNVY